MPQSVIEMLSISQEDLPKKQSRIAKLILLFVTCAYIAILHLVYHQIINPIFETDGYFLPTTQPLLFYFATNFLTIIPAIFLENRISRPSQLGFFFMYFFIFVPSGVVLQYSLPATIQYKLWIIFWLTAGAILTGLSAHIPEIRINKRTLSLSKLELGLLCLAIPANVIIIKSFGLRLSLPSIVLSEEYIARSEYKFAVESAGRLAYFSINWLCQVFNPLLLSHGIFSHRPLFAALAIFSQLQVFAITGFKHSLALIILVLLIYGAVFLFRDRIVKPLIVLTISVLFFGLWLGSDFEYVIFQSLLRRVLFTPPLVLGFYIWFFSENTFAWGLFERIISIFVTLDNPYKFPVPEIIGWEVYRTDMWCNGNIWARSFSTSGFIGILTAGFSILFFFYLVDCLCRKKEYTLVLIPAVVMFSGLLNGDLAGLMVSDGGWLFFVYLALMPRAKEKHLGIHRTHSL